MQGLRSIRLTTALMSIREASAERLTTASSRVLRCEEATRVRRGEEMVDRRWSNHGADDAASPFCEQDGPIASRLVVAIAVDLPPLVIEDA